MSKLESKTMIIRIVARIEKNTESLSVEIKEIKSNKIKNTITEMQF